MNPALTPDAGSAKGEGKESQVQWVSLSFMSNVHWSLLRVKLHKRSRSPFLSPHGERAAGKRRASDSRFRQVVG